MLNINCACQQSVIIAFLLLVSHYFNAIKNIKIIIDNFTNQFYKLFLPNNRYS